jgi:hypothetical protein
MGIPAWAPDWTLGHGTCVYYMCNKPFSLSNVCIQVRNRGGCLGREGTAEHTINRCVFLWGL